MRTLPSSTTSPLWWRTRSPRSTPIARRTASASSQCTWIRADAHHFPADVVRVMMRGQDSGDAQVLGREEIEDAADVEGGIDEEHLAGHAISDDVDEVRHLLRGRVTTGEVTTGEQLAKVER